MGGLIMVHADQLARECALSFAAQIRTRTSVGVRLLYATVRSAIQIALAALFIALIPSSGQAGTFVAFGPQQYVRGNGAPARVATTFSVLDPTTAYTMRIDSNGVSSAIVTLNGVNIFRESDF